MKMKPVYVYVCVCVCVCVMHFPQARQRKLRAAPGDYRYGEITRTLRMTLSWCADTSTWINLTGHSHSVDDVDGNMFVYTKFSSSLHKENILYIRRRVSISFSTI
ncbi:PREDICTED: uncharacterized protein LOC105146133 [Acromyrmex echinatior]|uniref:uncharacterized protein LOC105146133 n=1 Tax=Acromyrmex echinatior TaxID=103372 RepID=UPI0005810914|nr:PREDICTED: uncharacterized protein LOC105146133 [Acromyrmex echinatior]